MKQFLRGNAATFSDYCEEIQLILGEGDFVVFMSKGSGAQEGPMGPLLATSKRMGITIFCMHRFENDKIVVSS